MKADHRIIGVCNLDGPLSSAEFTKSTYQPFLIFGATKGCQIQRCGLAEIWKYLAGWRAEIALANSTDLTFVDDTTAFMEMGLIAELDPGGVAYGTIHGIRATVVEIAYMRGFFDLGFLGRETDFGEYCDRWRDFGFGQIVFCRLLIERKDTRTPGFK
jgi:hypothetical protein